jgi:hypothetical protein
MERETEDSRMASNEHRETFGMVVRVIGLIGVIYGLYTGWYTMAHLFGLQTRYNYPVSSTAAFSLFYLVLGLFILRGADWIVRFAYGPNSN